MQDKEIVTVIPAKSGYFVAVPVSPSAGHAPYIRVHRMEVIAWHIVTSRVESSAGEEFSAWVNPILVEGDISGYQIYAIVEPSGDVRFPDGEYVDPERLLEEFNLRAKALYSKSAAWQAA